LLEVAVSNGGLRKGMRGAQFALEWAIVVADQGEFPESVTEQVRTYCEWWQASERTAWHHLAEFREAFPGEQSPARLAVELAPQFVELVQRGRELQRARRARELRPALVGALVAPLPA
jgi:hypothetical protein